MVIDGPPPVPSTWGSKRAVYNNGWGGGAVQPTWAPEPATQGNGWGSWDPEPAAWSAENGEDSWGRPAAHDNGWGGDAANTWDTDSTGLAMQMDSDSTASAPSIVPLISLPSAPSGRLPSAVVQGMDSATEAMQTDSNLPPPAPSTANLASMSSTSSGPPASAVVQPVGQVPWSSVDIDFILSPLIREISPLGPGTLRCGPIASTFLAHGLLVVTQRSEVRLRTILRRHPGYQLSGVLRYGIVHGIAFDIALPLKHIGEFLPHPVPSRPPCYEHHFYDAPFSPSLNPPALVAAWKEKLVTVMARPHARSYLLKGGILWRLAIYANQSLLETVLTNVSSGVSMFGRHESPGSPGLAVEALDDTELMLVLGAVQQQSGWRSLWPLEAQFEYCFGFYGEWNSTCEEWFQSHLASLSNFRPMTKYQWYHYLSKYRSDQRLDSDSAFQATAAWYNRHAPSWHLRPLRHLS